MSHKKRIKYIYPLSPMQQGMLFHFLMNKKSNAYFEQLIFTLKGEVDVDILGKSFDFITERHDVIRTVFRIDNVKEPIQFVLNHRNFKLKSIDISHLNEKTKQEHFEDFKRKDMETGFDLSKDVLMRAAVVKLEKNLYKLIWSYHHILMDGWCLGIIFKEFMQVYRSLKNDKPVELPTVTPYIRYIKWLNKIDKQEGIAYWKKYLDGYEQKISLPKTGKEYPEDRYELKKFPLILDESLTGKIEALVRISRVTLNCVCQTAWGILLQRYHNCKDVVYGSVVSGRPSEIEGIETMVGLFINTIPIRIRSKEKQSYKELLNEVHRDSILSKPFEYLPLAEIQAESLIKRDLIDHIFVFENYPVEKEVTESNNRPDVGFEVEGVSIVDQTNYNFGVIISPGKRIFVEFKYNAFVYGRETIEKIAETYKSILVETAENPDMMISELEIVSKQERMKLLLEFNRTEKDYPAGSTIRELFERQVEKNPDFTAVICEDKCFSYLHLNRESNRLARLLEQKGLKRNTIAGVMTYPAVEMITAIMAILKAGGAYLPIDPEHPDNRVTYLLRDSNVNLLLLQAGLKNRIDFAGESIVIDNAKMYPGEHSNLAPQSHSRDLLYTIYTSGTTGKSKGVLIRNENLVNYISWFSRKFDITVKDRTVLISSFSFDLGYTAIYSSILNGGELHILAKETYLSAENLIKYLKKNEISYIKITPSFFSTLINSPFFSANHFSNLRLVVLGGEEIRVQDVEKAKNICTHLQIMNHYGPTENTIGSIAKLLDFDYFEEYKRNITIGEPVNNTNISIMNEDSKLQPIGIPGEICIGGAGTASGYLNKIELTANKFVAHPYGNGKKLYRTGDIGRWTENGEIVFSGRCDNQVKIRGYRIEAGEIEIKLQAHNDISETVVQVIEDENKNRALCAYIVSKNKIEDNTLREYLAGYIPDYMIPAYFIRLENIILTSNGKVDKNALPLPEFRQSKNQVLAPANKIEEKIVEIWSKILKKEKDAISIDANFFDLGGHSLDVVLLISEIYKEFEIEIPIMETYQKPYIKNISEYIIKGFRSFEDQELILLNKKAGTNIFAFPPGIGYGLSYKKLASFFDDYSFYAFNYIEGENDLNKYVRSIIDIQPRGPYILFGWSRGGTLAFEVAKEIEQQGFHISDIILLDGYKKETKIENSPEEIHSRILELMEGIEKNVYIPDFIKKNVFKKAYEYGKYWEKIINEGKVNANIHLIESMIKKENVIYTGWHDSTKKSYLTYNGFGKHEEMLQPGLIEKNVMLIKDILRRYIPVR